MEKFDAPFGSVVSIGQTDKLGCSILIIEPGKEITPHYHKKTKEIEVILEGTVVCRNKTQKKDDVNIWEPNETHGYMNKSNKDVKILCVTIPPYDPNDVFEMER